MLADTRSWKLLSLSLLPRRSLVPPRRRCDASGAWMMSTCFLLGSFVALKKPRSSVKHHHGTRGLHSFPFRLNLSALYGMSVV